MSIRILIIGAQFNRNITEALLSGAMEHFTKEGLAENQIETVWVPGAFELATVASAAAKAGQFSAILCLGAVVKGDTMHFEYICEATTLELAKIGPATGVPVIFGVLTTLNMQQAHERCGMKGPNHGSDLAKSTLEMIKCMARLTGSKK